MFLGGIVLLTVCGAYLPLSQLKMAVKERKIQIQKALPDLLDMLASTVQAGQAFNSALASAQEIAVGPLGEEIKAALSEVRLGRSRSDALRSMAARVRQEQLSTTITAIVQAERLGSNLSLVLEELSEEVRNRRMTRAEEIANLMPTKMVIPMALFMLPALFVMIFGGVAAEYFARPQ
jgi:tight adherence protein C